MREFGTERRNVCDTLPFTVVYCNMRRLVRKLLSRFIGLISSSSYLFNSFPPPDDSQKMDGQTILVASLFSKIYLSAFENCNSTIGKQLEQQ